MDTTKIVVTGWSEGFKQLIIVLGAWWAMEFGVPAPLMVAVLPESILALVIFHQNSTVCFFTIPPCGIPPILRAISGTVGDSLPVIICKV